MRFLRLDHPVILPDGQRLAALTLRRWTTAEAILLHHEFGDVQDPNEFLGRVLAVATGVEFETLCKCHPDDLGRAVDLLNAIMDEGPDAHTTTTAPTRAN